MVHELTFNRFEQGVDIGSVVNFDVGAELVRRGDASEIVVIGEHGHALWGDEGMRCAVYFAENTLQALLGILFRLFSRVCEDVLHARKQQIGLGRGLTELSVAFEGLRSCVERIDKVAISSDHRCDDLFEFGLGSGHARTIPTRRG